VFLILNAAFITVNNGHVLMPVVLLLGPVCCYYYLKNIPWCLLWKLKCFRLPEIPPDTPETNPIMRVNEYPEFSTITPQKIVTGCAKLAIEFDVQLGKHVENLKGELLQLEISLLTWINRFFSVLF
jgi:hypothetical protein